MLRPDLSVADLGELSVVHVSGVAEGANAWVESEGDYWTLIKASGAPIGPNVIAPFPGSPRAGAETARWVRQEPTSGVFGNGSDGPIEVTGVLTLTRDLYATTFHVAPTGVVHASGFRVFATESIITDPGSIVEIDGSAAVGASGGAGAGGNFDGLAGGNGTVNAGGNSTDALFMGGIGGVGGAAAGGAGGLSLGTLVPVPHDLTTILLFSSFVGVFGGAGGGGGAGDTAISGGGGGGGAGSLLFAAPRIQINGTLSAQGGAGAASLGGNAAGGAGAGGGVIFLLGTVIDTTGPILVNGGAFGAGTGTGNPGIVGATGAVVQVPAP